MNDTEYHVAVFLVPHEHADATEETAILDREFSSGEGSGKVAEVIQAAVDRLQAGVTEFETAYLRPALPGFPETPCTVIGQVVGKTGPARYQIRLEGGAYCAVPEDRLRFENSTREEN